jgi:hypothetical protein
MWRLAICGRYVCAKRGCAAAFAAVLFWYGITLAISTVTHHDTSLTNAV